jgi:5-enolpyruvylshikimate-3-phosphate synthase
MTNALTILPPFRPLRGSVAPPGSKSITNRALLMAALAKGTSHIEGALKSDDTRHMAVALRAMSVIVDEPDDTTFVIAGTGQLQAPKEPLFLGNAGTATRFLTAAAALVEGTVTVTGDAHMQKRPIGPLISAMRALGIEVEAPSGCPPVTVLGRGSFDGTRVVIDGGLSSQYVSALLMLAPGARHPIEVALDGDVIGARGYIDLTCAAMRHFGVHVEQKDSATWLVRPGGYRPATLHVEPDASAATYLWAAEALTQGSIDIGITSDAFTQPDAAAYNLIRQFPHLPCNRRFTNARRRANARHISGLQYDAGPFRRYSQPASQGMRSDMRDGDRIIPPIPRPSCRRWRRSCRDASSRGKLFRRLHSDLFRPSHSDEFGVGGPPCVRCNHSRPGLRRKDLSWLLEGHGGFGGFGEARLRLIGKDQNFAPPLFAPKAAISARHKTRLFDDHAA